MTGPGNHDSIKVRLESVLFSESSKAFKARVLGFDGYFQTPANHGSL